MVTAALAVGLMAAAVQWRQSAEALAARQAAERTRIENLYHRIDDDLNDVDVSLSKLSAAGSPRQTVLLLGDVWRATGSAGAAMALLPLSHADSCDMSQFVTRCGDYAHALMGRVLQGRALTDRDKQQLRDMRTACAQIRQTAGEARSTKGVSLLFYSFILLGYICALIGKLILIRYYAPAPWYETVHWYVLFFYVVNTVMVTAGILIYFRNKALEREAQR